MDTKYQRQDDDISQSPFLREGLPTEWQIFKEADENIFGFNKQMFNIEFEKQDRGKTGDFCQEDDCDMVQFRENPKINEFQIISEFQELLPDVQSRSTIENKCFQEEQLGQVQQQVNVEKKYHQSKVNIKNKKIKNKKKGRGSARRKNRRKGEFSSETKNIPKNFGKQIIKFIKKQRILTEKVLKFIGSHYNCDQLNSELKKKKKSLNKISDLRKLWLGVEFSKELRVMTGIFLRKYCLPWVFNSRIKNIKYPIKYRYRIIEGVEKPEDFLYLKDF